MQTKLYNQTGKEIGMADLPSAIFEVPMNVDVLHNVVQSQMANARHPIAHTKGRGEVRGGGKKPWRQKGTGRARHASIRSPIWKGGGVAFGPTKERNFARKVNKKTMRLALAMILSAKVKDDKLRMLDHIEFSEPKTKQAVQMFKQFVGARDSILVITPKKDRNLERAIRNIQGASVISADSLNVRDVMVPKYLMLAQDALPIIQKTFK